MKIIITKRWKKKQHKFYSDSVVYKPSKYSYTFIFLSIFLSPILHNDQVSQVEIHCIFSVTLISHHITSFTLLPHTHTFRFKSLKNLTNRDLCDYCFEKNFFFANFLTFNFKKLATSFIIIFASVICVWQSSFH